MHRSVRRSIVARLSQVNSPINCRSHGPLLPSGASLLRNCPAGPQARRPVSNHRVLERISQEVAAGLSSMESRMAEKPIDFLPSPHCSLRSSERSQRPQTPLSHLLRQWVYAASGRTGQLTVVSYIANNREYASLLRHPEPRPWLVCVHGTEMNIPC